MLLTIGISAVSTVVGILFHHQAQERLCVNRMYILWGCAKSYGLDQNKQFIEQVSVSELQRFVGLPPVTGVCPGNGAEYKPFRFVDGPICPDGHRMPEAARAEMGKFMWDIQERNWGREGDKADGVRPTMPSSVPLTRGTPPAGQEPRLGSRSAHG